MEGIFIHLKDLDLSAFYLILTKHLTEGNCFFSQHNQNYNTDSGQVTVIVIFYFIFLIIY